MLHNKFYNFIQFLIGNEGTLHAHGLVEADWIKEHITLAQKLFRTAHVNDGAGVRLGRNRKGNAGGDIGLDDAGDNIHGGPLRCQNQMNTGRTRLLRQAQNCVLHIHLSHHHQIRKLVYYDDNARPAVVLILPRGVIGVDLAVTVFAQLLVPLIHLVGCPAQRTGGLVLIRYDRAEQMRKRSVDLEFHDLGIDKYHAHFLGRKAVCQAQNDAVDAYGFT